MHLSFVGTFFSAIYFMFVAFAAAQKKTNSNERKVNENVFYMLGKFFFFCVLCAMHICELGNSMRNVFNINTLEALGVVYNMLYVYIYV